MYEAMITFVYPSVNAMARTVEFRAELDNPDAALRPDMWAHIELEINLGEGLVVPASSVIDTGKRLLVFIDQGNGHLEPRDIQVSTRSDDDYLIKEGLAEGDRVVTRALFLVDSESQLQAAIAGMKQTGGHKH